MTVTVEQLSEDGALAPIHENVADLLRRIGGEEPLVALAAALASEQLSRGHVCLELDRAAEITFRVDVEGREPVSYSEWPEPEGWARTLANSPAVVTEDDADATADAEAPLVLDRAHRRVYLARHWFYERQLAAHIRQRLAASRIEVHEETLRADVERLFPRRAEPAERDQCLAAAHAIDQRFTVITGGPGTGKTTTVAKLLALRLRQAERAGADLPKITVMAPTGKAAARLSESLAAAAEGLPVEESTRHELGRVEAKTIHRALGWSSAPPERGGPFVHDARIPLETDLVVVDEASMVDLGLMQRLLDAIRPEAQVILVGDRDQLASVEAGGVLADLCAEDSPLTDRSRLGSERAALLGERTTPASMEKAAIGPGLAALQHSHRFTAEGELGRLAQAIRAGDEEAVMAALRRGGELVSWHAHGAAVIEEAADGYSPYLDALAAEPAGSREVVRAANRFRVLCAHHTGSWGAEAMNRRIAEALEHRGRLQPRPGPYHGRPVLVTRNDHRRGLFNGDLGVVVEGERGPEALFEDAAAEDGCRRFPAAMLRGAVDCFAMTIHKAQGSEFHELMVVLPERASPLVTRELLYTAVTRVADATDSETGERRAGRVCVVGAEEVIRSGVRQRVRRSSGLREAIAT